MARRTKKALRKAQQNSGGKKLSPGQALMKAAGTRLLEQQLTEAQSIKNYDEIGATRGRFGEAAQPQALPELLSPAQTEEQRQVLAAGEAVRCLLANPEYQAVHTAMMCARQTNYLAFRQLQAMLAKEKDLPPLTQDVFIGAIAYAAAKPFSEHTFVNTLVREFMPWLAKVVDMHSVKDAAAEAEARVSADEKRRNQPVPLGFKYDAAVAASGDRNRHDVWCEEESLTRQRSLVLVGWAPALYWLFDKVVGHVLANENHYQVLRLRGQTVKHHQAEKRLAVIKRENWLGCCNTKEALRRMMGEFALPQLSSMPDLVICDNLGETYDAAYTGRDHAANAGDGHKHLSAWCQGVASAVLAGLPVVTTDKPDLTSMAYEQLRVFTYLRPLLVETLEEKYRITVGAPPAAVFEVSREEVDAYAPRTLVT